MIPLGVLAQRQAATGGGWTPAALGSLLAWYDASDPATITASGGTVSAWADKSGNGLTLAPWSTGPTTGAETQNGLNVVSFTQDPMATSLVTSAQPLTVAFVGKYGTAQWTPAVSLNASAPSYPIYHGDGTWLAYSGAALTSPTAYDTNPHVFTSIHAGTESSLRLDGTGIASGNAGTNGLARVNLGAAENAGGITGWIAEVVIVSAALTGTDLTNLENYLLDKWGI